MPADPHIEAETRNHGVMTAQAIELDSGGGLTARFVPEAGMIGVSLQDSGVEVLGQRRGLEAYVTQGKTMGLPILYPWANRLAGDRYRFHGEQVDLSGEIPGMHRDENGLPIHGTLAASGLWRVEQGASGKQSGRTTLTATLEFGDHPDLLRAFPFPHRISLEFILSGRSLEVTTTVIPTGETPVPLAFGFHPYLTLPGVDRPEWTVETPPVIELDADREGIPTGVERDLPARSFQLEERSIDQGYRGLADGSRFSLQGGGRRITVELIAGFPAAQVYAPSTDDVVCFEPMKSPAAALSSGRNLATVGPGGQDVSRFSITVERLPVPSSRPVGPGVHYRLRPGAPAGEVVEVIRGRALSAVTQLGEATPEDQAAAVHEARKDVKKIRGALRLVRGELGEDRFRSENRRFRDAARLLSGMRDTEVMAETVAALIESHPEAAAQLEPVRTELGTQADRIRQGSGRRDAETRMRMAAEAIESGAAGLDDWQLDDRGWDSYRPGLRRTYRDGRRGLKQVEDQLRADRVGDAAGEVHQWRKRVKDLWYQLRLLRDAWKQGLGGPVDELDRLADLLGDFNDLAVLDREIAASRSGEPRVDDLSALIATRQGELLDSALPIGRLIYAESPSRFSDRIGSYWQI